MTKRSTRAVAGSAALLFFVNVAAAGAATPTPLGAATPQALVERMIGAAKSSNIGELVACMDEKSRHEAALGLLAATTMMVAFMSMGTDMAAGMAQGVGEAVSGQKMKAEDKAKMDKAKAEAKVKMDKAKTGLSAVLKKHGLPNFLDEKAKLPEKDAAAAMFKNVDEPALVNDLFAFMGTLGEAKDTGGMTGPGGGPMAIPDMKDVKNYKISGDKATAKAGAETLDFVKVSDRWFFHPPDKSPDKGPDGGPDSTKDKATKDKKRNN